MNRSERLKKLRQDLHLSQTYVAEHLGINRSSFNKLENGKRKLDPDEIIALGNLYGVTADYILNGEPRPDKSTYFARTFETLSENDQEEILNAIRFKKRLKDKLNDKQRD